MTRSRGLHFRGFRHVGHVVCVYVCVCPHTYTHLHFSHFFLLEPQIKIILRRQSSRRSVDLLYTFLERLDDSCESMVWNNVGPAVYRTYEGSGQGRESAVGQVSLSSPPADDETISLIALDRQVEPCGK